MSTIRSAYRRDGPNGWDDPDDSPEDRADVGAHIVRQGRVMPGESQTKPLDETAGGSSDAHDARHGPGEHHDRADNDDDDLNEDEDHGANPPGVPGDPGHDDHGHHDDDGHESRDGPGEHHDLADNDDDLDEDEGEDHDANPPGMPSDPGHDDHGHHDGDAH